MGKSALPPQFVAFVLLFFSVFADAKMLDLNPQLIASNNKTAQAMFLIKKDRYSGKATSVQIDSKEFFTQASLNAEYNSRDGFVILAAVVVDGQSFVQAYTPIRFHSVHQYEMYRMQNKANLSHCLTAANEVTQCILHREQAVARLGGALTVGQIRKVQSVQDALILVTNAGKMFVYRLSGNFNQPDSKLTQIHVPAQLGQELLTQDLTKFYFSNGFYDVVLGINGELGGRAFGSKIWNVSGQTDLVKGKKRFLSPIAVTDNLFFEVQGSRYYAYDKNIVVDLVPVEAVLRNDRYRQPDRILLKMGNLQEVK